MKNKKLLSILSVTLAAVILVGGVFAFFSAEAFTNPIPAKVGTVNIGVTATASHTQLSRDVLAIMEYNGLDYYDLGYDMVLTEEELTADLSTADLRAILQERLFEEAENNLNPGDNQYIEYEYSNVDRPGTDYEINIEIENLGTKSVETRVLVEISEVNEDGISAQDATANYWLEGIKVYFDPYNSLSGVTSIHANSYYFNKYF